MFVDPVLGVPLGLYIHDDVEDRASLVHLVSENGGDVSASLSGVPYILVDPSKQSGQALCRRYTGKKGKLVLDARWIRECLRFRSLLLFHDNWGGCMITPTDLPAAKPSHDPQVSQHLSPSQEDSQQHTDELQDQVSQPTFEYSYPIPPGIARPNNPWRSSSSYQATHWDNSHNQSFYLDTPPEAQPFHSAVHTAGSSSNGTADLSDSHGAMDSARIPERESAAELSRGRKRQRVSPPYISAPSSLIISRKRGTVRSPTPPSRVVKSTYGGNLFTAEDVIYLRRYIEYCHDQGLVLSLRQICEKVAQKAPHHSFFSWRRYCNKHQIRLRGYTMHSGVRESEEDEISALSHTDPVPTMVRRPYIEDMTTRKRSPTPPRALYRSTTGKGVAFTQEDIKFLVRFLEYRKSQGSVDMVVFWKDVATKAPHHSRASWMKFWRRHKHELNHTEADDPLPAPPAKKMRYSAEDDILLAKFFATNPPGISDKVFQAFARQYPHHPWKGWQEHHRIHKDKIDHLIIRLQAGELL